MPGVNVRQVVREEIQLAFETLATRAKSASYTEPEPLAGVCRVVASLAEQCAEAAPHSRYCPARSYVDVECNCGADEED